MLPNSSGNKTRNSLEKFAWDQLTKEGIQFDYEKEVELFPSFSFTGMAIEKRAKNLVVKTPKLQNMVYSPDFMGNKWVIETKGLRRPAFDLRWKIFKYLIKDQGWLLLMPTNQLEVLVSIEILKKWLKNDREWSNNRILQEQENIKQLAQKRTKSKVVKTKKR